jgi:hypothetical protein
MRWFSTTFVFGIFLFFMQAGIAASFLSQDLVFPETDSSLKMSSLHHATGMATMAEDSCCMVDCENCASECTVSSVIVVSAIIQNKSISHRETFTPYAFDIPQSFANSLFRPPIYS